METSEIVSTSIRKVKKEINPGLTPFFSPAIEFIGIMINHQSQLPNKVLIALQTLVGSIQTELTENERAWYFRAEKLLVGSTSTFNYVVSVCNRKENINKWDGDD